jgi:hypothetical protein
MNPSRRQISRFTVSIGLLKLRLAIATGGEDKAESQDFNMKEPGDGNGIQ